MRRIVLGVALAAGLTIAGSGAASAQVVVVAPPGIGAPGVGVPGLGFPGLGFQQQQQGIPQGAGGPYLAGNYPIFNSVTGVGLGPPNGPFYGNYYQTLGDPYGYGFPASYQYPYGFQFGNPPIWGQNGGIGFTFNSLNNGQFGTGITSTNTSTLGNPTGGVTRSLTVLPLSAIGRISQIPTQVTNSLNEVIIR